MAMVEELSTAEAVLLVEEEMSILAGQIRLSVRNAALAVDPALQPFGLKLLRLIMRCGPKHSSAAAEALFVDRSVISRQAKQLEELGLITNHVDPADGRARLLEITPLGAERLSEALASNPIALHDRMGSWPAKDLLVFREYIVRLNGSPDSDSA